MKKDIERLRLSYIAKLIKVVSGYRRYGFDARVVTPVFRKKLEFLRDATSKTQMEAILKPSCPHYDGVKFIPGPYHVDEEELIGWSMASLRAPLAHYAYERYAQVFKSVFPDADVFAESREARQNNA